MIFQLMFIVFLKILLILGVLFFAIFFWVFSISRKNFIYVREKSRPFECGFDPKSKARIPFSLRFFIIIIIFLIFDVEISLLLQVPFEFGEKYFGNRLIFLLFLWILIAGTMEEWRRGVLNWAD